MITGALRLFVPAVIVWITSAVCIATSGLALKLFWFILVINSLIIALFFTRYLRKVNFITLKIKRFLTVTLLTSAMLIIILARIAAIEHSASSASNHLGIENNGPIREVVTVSDFASSISGFSDERFAVKAKYSGKSGSISLILWIEGAEARNWSPGTKLLIHGKAEKQPPASQSDYEVSVKRYDSLEDHASLVTHLRLALQDAASNHENATLVPGFAVGDTSLVSSELDLMMLESSLTHLTAVSGANCALVTGAIFLLSGYFGARRKTRIVIAALSLLSFVVVVGPDASVQRAALMAAVTLISGFGGKKSVALPALATAMLILLFIDPWQSRAPGFTLSVAATFGILVFVPSLTLWISKIIKIPGVLLLPITVTLAAQIACAPLLLLLQPGIPAAGIPANVLAAPAAPLGTAAGLMALVLLPIHHEFGNFWVWIGSFASKWVEAVATVSIELPLARWYWPGGALGAILLFIIELAVIFAVLIWRDYKTPRRPWSQKPQQSLMLSGLVTGLVSLAGALFLSITAVTPFAWTLAAPKDWIIVACDVGQGDATLIRNPSTPEQIILIDTGKDEQPLKDCLHLFGVTRISLLILTHDDSDHVGALPTIINKTDAAIIAPTTWGNFEEDREVIKQLKRESVPFNIATSGMRGSLGQSDATSIQWETLWPNEGSLSLDDNSGSLVMNIRVGETKVLILGDTGAKEHQALLHNSAMLEADVIKIAHHGSGNQDPNIIAASGAKYGVISAGADNKYGHPHNDVLFALNLYGVEPLRTDQSGSIAIMIDQNSLEIEVWGQK